MPPLRSALCFLLLIFVFIIQTNEMDNFDYYEENLESSNQYIDNLIQVALSDSQKRLDPFKLEDVQFEYDIPIVHFNKVGGTVNLREGFITGLKSIHRIQDCTLDQKSANLLVTADLGVRNLKFYYAGNLTLNLLDSVLSVQGELDYVEIHMEFIIDSNTGLFGTLTSFEIDHMEGMRIDTKGLGPMKYLEKFIMGRLTIYFEGGVGDVMKQFGDHLSDKLFKYVFPI